MHIMNKKEHVFRLLSHGLSVKTIATRVERSLSTVYKYRREYMKIHVLPQLKREIKNVLLCGDMNVYLKNLSWSKLSLLKCEFNLDGHTRKEKERALYAYFSKNNLLGLYQSRLEVATIYG